MISYSLIDLTGVMLAAALYVPIAVLPGCALAAIAGLRQQKPVPAWAFASVLALAILPGTDSTIVRFAGLAPAIIFNLLLACVGLAVAIRRGWRPPGAASLLIGALWLLIVVAETIDIDWSGKLYQGYVVIDMVKHAATTRAIVDTGAPPADPFVARPGDAGYYYFFYTLCALAQKLGSGLIDARAAVAGLIFWTGIALFGLARLLLARTGLVPQDNGRFASRVLLGLMAASGLDILAMLWSGLRNGAWYPQLDMWNEAVASWADSLLWVPHHLAAMVATWVGILILASEIRDVEGGSRPRALALLMAALAFMSAVGLSVWLTLVAVLTVTFWLMLLAVERRWRAVALLVSAGALSLILAAPHLHDMVANRAYDGPTIGPTIRAFDRWDRWAPSEAIRYAGRLLLLPLNYALELGVFLVGSLLFWRHHRSSRVHQEEVARVLVLSALASFIFASFVRATVIYNDIGWRAPLFLQLAALLWTTAEVVRISASGGVRAYPAGSAALVGLFLLGCASSIYGLVAMRAYIAMSVVDWAEYVNRSPRIDRELRSAYASLNRRLPPDAVLQHNPLPRRVFDFGLYSRHDVAVADRDASLYGASKAVVEQRVRDLGAIFAGSLRPAEVRRCAEGYGIDALIVTADDRVWRDRTSWLWRAPTLHASERVRVVPIAALEGR